MTAIGKMCSEVFLHLFKKPATEPYPFGAPEVPEKLRGMIRFFAEKCIGCKLCMRDCPSNAITINKIGEKEFEAVFDLDACIYCAQCVYSCNKDALESTTNFELAQLDKSKLRVTFRLDKNKGNNAEAAGTAAPENSNQ